MKIEDIFQLESIDDIIDTLKKKNVKVTDWETAQKEYEPLQHMIMDKGLYPDKQIKNAKGEVTRIEYITRVVVGLQKLAVKRMAEFMFTLPFDMTLDNEDETSKAQFKSLKKILRKNRFVSMMKKLCKTVSSECEAAVYWYTTESEKHNLYLLPIPAVHKIRHAVFSPSNGDSLYPLFDETGDMIAFSRGYKVEVGDEEIEFFETWTANKYVRYEKTDTGWVQVQSLENPIGKIPIVYIYRESPIWHDADNGKVHELELLLSRNGDIIAYHAGPVLLIKGELQGAPEKGESNKVFTTDSDGGAEYISWQQSPESVRFQFETLLRSFFMELQLPDLSFENIKGLGAQSGESRKWLMVDAHLKVGDESDIYIDAIGRMFNVIKSYMAVMNKGWAKTIDSVDIDIEINPFTIDDEKERLDVIIAANGGKPVVSQEKSIELAALTEDPKAEFIKIEAEYAKSRTENVFQPFE